MEFYKKCQNFDGKILEGAESRCKIAIFHKTLPDVLQHANTLNITLGIALSYTGRYTTLNLCDKTIGEWVLKCRTFLATIWFASQRQLQPVP
jgi:hypothetical protein